MKKIENYLSACEQLFRAVPSYLETPDDDLRRDGLIQRFEFTVELAWKALKEYMEDQGMSVNFATPKSVLKDAYAAGLIADEHVWLDILQSRNLTSHIYDEETAISVVLRIRDEYLPSFRSLAELFRNK